MWRAPSMRNSSLSSVPAAFGKRILAHVLGVGIGSASGSPAPTAGANFPTLCVEISPSVASTDYMSGCGSRDRPGR